MKTPQYITAFRTVSVAITLAFILLLLLGDALGSLAALVKGA
jgi:hypothetical protein